MLLRAHARHVLCLSLSLSHAHTSYEHINDISDSMYICFQEASGRNIRTSGSISKNHRALA